PAPPHVAGMVTPSRPCRAAACMTSVGYSPLLSIAAARGATMSRANCSISSLNARCAGVSSRFISTLVLAGEPLEDRLHPLLGLAQILGQDARLADDRHEIGVAGPARHEVDVDVIDDAGAGRAAEIDADVDPLRRVRFGERDLGVAREAHQLRALRLRRRLQ